MNTEKNKKIWLKKCEETLKMGGRSEVTIRNYIFIIKKFLNCYEDTIKISKLTIADLTKHFKKYFLDKNKSASTYNTNLAAIRYFYLVCFDRNISKTLLPTSKIRKRYPTIISKEQFLTIVNKEENLKHKCWLLLSFCCGLRICEVATLRVENINYKEHKLKVLGKGNKERFTILPDIVIKYLRLYYKNQKFIHKTGYMFIGNSNKPHIDPRRVGNYFTGLKKDYQLPKEITEHSLRHSFATYYLMNGGDLLTLKSMMGHKSLASTSIYIHMSNDFNNLKGIDYAK